MPHWLPQQLAPTVRIFNRIKGYFSSFVNLTSAADNPYNLKAKILQLRVFKMSS